MSKGKHLLVKVSLKTLLFTLNWLSCVLFVFGVLVLQFICHQKCNIKYSPEKMWYVACLVRGMKIDEAIAQLKFVDKKGAVAARETLEEARELAVREHCVEFPSNLWVCK